MSYYTGIGGNFFVEQKENSIVLTGNVFEVLELFKIKQFISSDMYQSIVSHPDLKLPIEQSKSFEIVEEDENVEQKKVLWTL